jgi:uncharacterized damage-inducible protein DinB
MTLTDLNRLYDYHYWARDRLLDGVTALSVEEFTRNLHSSFGSVRDTVAHICDAEHIWLSRWKGGPYPTGFQNPARMPDIAAARAEWASLETEMRALLGPLSEADLDRVIQYSDFKGAPRSFPLWQMAQHVVNHASYHRGQVTTLMRQLGAQPPKCEDVIAYYLELQG